METQNSYTKEKIIEAAFALIRKKGRSALSARNIAKELGSSTMPIYSYVNSIKELEQQLLEKARLLLKEYQTRNYTEHVLLNLSFGYVVFARDEKYLFRFLYQDNPNKFEMQKLDTIKNMLINDFGEESEQIKALKGIEGVGDEASVKYPWIFTHGLATMVNSEMLTVCSDELLIKYLKDAGAAFYIWASSINGK